MDASHTCELLLNVVRNSNLNYCLSESLFSVTIHIKKSFIKDKDGTKRGFISSNLSRYDGHTNDENRRLADENKSLKSDLAAIKDNNDLLENTVKLHAVELDNTKIELGNISKEKEELLKEIATKSAEVGNIHDKVVQMKVENDEKDKNLLSIKSELNKIMLENVSAQNEIIKLEEKLKKIKLPPFVSINTGNPTSANHHPVLNSKFSTPTPTCCRHRCTTGRRRTPSGNPLSPSVCCYHSCQSGRDRG